MQTTTSEEETTSDSNIKTTFLTSQQHLCLAVPPTASNMWHDERKKHTLQRLSLFQFISPFNPHSKQKTSSEELVKFVGRVLFLFTSLFQMIAKYMNQYRKVREQLTSS